MNSGHSVSLGADESFVAVGAVWDGGRPGVLDGSEDFVYAIAGDASWAARFARRSTPAGSVVGLECRMVLKTSYKRLQGMQAGPSDWPVGPLLLGQRSAWGAEWH